MRPGALAKRGLTMEKLQEVNPAIVFCSISGYGATGPYRDMPSHGIAYDTWAGQVPVEVDENGFTVMAEHTSVGIHAGPLYGALAILAAVIRARATGEGCAHGDRPVRRGGLLRLVPHRDVEGATSGPQDEVYGNAADDGERRAPGIGGMRGGVRYQIYAIDRRARAVHGERAGVLEELLRRRRPPGSVRAWPGHDVRRPRPRQHRAAGAS